VVNTYKSVWEFVDTNGNQWTEVYYIQGSTPASVLSFGPALYNSRLLLASDLVTWSRVRVSDVANTRSTATRVLNWVGTDNTAGSPGPAGLTVVSNLVGITGGSRKLQMRGVPDYMIGRDQKSGRDVLGSTLRTRLTAFYQGLQTDGYGMRQLQQTPKYPVVTVDGATIPGSAILTFTNPGPGLPNSFAPPNRLVLSQMDKKLFPGLNGHWSILAANGLTITIRYQVAGNKLLNGQFGFVKLEGYQGLSIFNAAQCGFDHFGTRTTKVPLSRSRGARRAVRIRSLA
jgi:hypothetical protein